MVLVIFVKDNVNVMRCIVINLIVQKKNVQIVVPDMDNVMMVHVSVILDFN